MNNTVRTPKGLPYFTQGEIIKGFGRGSKQLGIPTANFAEDVIEKLPPEIETGVYFGYASINNSPVYKMVMSVGWNPFYKNQKKSMETHIMHKFNEDLYGKMLKVVMLGYLRPEQDFSSLDDIIKKINEDIQQAEELLDQPEYLEYKNNSFFSH